MQRNNRKNIVGKVVKIANEKTLTILFEKRVLHAKYKKLIKKSRKYHVDNSLGLDLNIGEKVMIESCRPISKLKRWRLVKKIEK